MLHFELEKKLLAADGEMTLNACCSLQEGDFLAIYGASGAGKTSILRMLSGLMRPDYGQIIVQGKTWLDSTKKIHLPPQKRGVGYVFQDYALFPNMTVRQNLSYALHKNQNPDIINHLIETVELDALQNRLPQSLSGGQKQRVALARALVQQPKLLLLDEPLSALDETMRSKLQDYLLQVHQQFKLTTILVSHDLAEIYKMANQVLILEKGQITQSGTPDEVFGQRNGSGQFRSIGRIVHIQANPVVCIIQVLVGQNLIKVVATDEEIQQFAIGDRVMVVSKAFNPLIRKI